MKDQTREAVTLLLAGLSFKEIAAKQNRKTFTVYRSIERLRYKHKCKNTSSLLATLLRKGLV